MYAPEGLAALAVPDAAAGPEASGTSSNSVDFKPLPWSNSVDFRPLPSSNSLDFKPAGSGGASAWAGGSACDQRPAAWSFHHLPPGGKGDPVAVEGGTPGIAAVRYAEPAKEGASDGGGIRSPWE